MTYRVWLVAPALIGLAVGCVPGPNNNMIVPTNPFGDGRKVETPTPHEASKVTEQSAINVVRVGQKILAANPGLKLQPQFILVGRPDEEIFHREKDILITEGLAQKCQSEAQLAAVLCHELGKMVSEREGVERFRLRADDRSPPVDVPVGNDYHGVLGAADNTHQIELARYEQERKNRRSKPEDLARAYLIKAGYKASDLTDVGPLLRAADRNASVEKQMTGKFMAR
jgi:predicted Zn-dependent protease